MITIREKIERALAKPIAPNGEVHVGHFDPWCDVIEGVDGSYSSKSDELMIAALEAVRDKTTFAFIEDRGFVAEFSLYVLSGHGLTDYGTSPRGGFPDYEIRDLWQPLIDKWKAYAAAAWAEAANAR